MKEVTLRPPRSVIWQIGLAIAMLLIPLLFVVLLVKHRPTSVPLLTGSLVSLVLLCVVATVQYGRTHVKIGPTGIVERTFFGGHRNIDRVIRLHLYEGTSLDTVNQLFVVGRNGRCLFRMTKLWTG